MKKRHLQIAFIVLCVAFLVAGAVTFAKGKPGGTKPCKPPLIQCLDVWNPVICSDGNVYSNACYAKRACATGCVPLGGGPILLDR
jgi:hypothetical protein